MIPSPNYLFNDAVALMEQINLRLLDRRLMEMRMRRRGRAMEERPVLDDQALSRLLPETSTRD